MTSTHLTENLSRNKTLIYYLLKQIISEPISKVEPIGNAKTSYVYEVNKHLIVKFPSYRTIVSDWQRQCENAPVLQSLFSFKIPQPKLKDVFLTSASAQSLSASFYEKIDGRIIKRDDFANQPIDFKCRFFEQLSDAAMQIHSVDISKLPALPLKSEEMARRLIPIRQGNFIFNGLFYGLIHFPFCGFECSSQRTLCHSDLHSGNICLDKNNNLVGILDFDTLNQGFLFTEFRPLLYKKEEDIHLFRQIYERRSGNVISEKNMQWMNTVYKAMCLSSAATRIRKIATFKKQLPSSSRDRSFL